jgi:flagellin-like protein
MRKRLIIRKDEQGVSPVIATILMVAITVVLAAVLYVMVTGLLTGPGGAPQTIAVNRLDTASHYVLSVTAVPTAHGLTTTTFLMRWPSNQSVAAPPGQASLDSLKTESGGVKYNPVSGAAQVDLRPSDVITISKSMSYVTGMQITISDGSSIIWTGTL